MLENLSFLTALQDLRLDPEDNKLIAAEMFEKLTALTSLRLDCTDVQVPMQAKVLSNKPHLQHLELAYVGFFDEDYSEDEDGVALSCEGILSY